MRKNVSLRVIRRISFYYEALLKLNFPQNTYISSKKLEEITGISCNQVRQDFFYLGIAIGRQKKGYQVRKLFKELKKVLSIERGANVIIIGAGRIGQSLAEYKLFKDRNITVTALFDIKPELVGQQVGRDDTGKKPVYHIDQLENYLRENIDIKIALLTIPENVAQEVMERLIQLGLKGIINFAPKILKLPEDIRDVYLINDSIGTSLYKVVYQLYHKR